MVIPYKKLYLNKMLESVWIQIIRIHEDSYEFIIFLDHISEVGCKDHTDVDYLIKKFEKSLHHNSWFTVIHFNNSFVNLKLSF